MMTPLDTLANSGTPLMWGACGWLVLGNALIGMLEWKMAAKRLNLPLSQGLFIVANYASAIGGYYAADLVKQRIDLVLAGFTGLLAMWAGAFVLTLAVEGLFLWLQIRKDGVTRTNFWKTLVTVNVATYAIIFPLSFVLGSTKMWREVDVVQASEIKSIPGWAYYLTPDRRTVRRVRLDGSKDEMVARLDRQVWEAFVDPSRDGKHAVLMGEDRPFRTVGVGAQAAVLNVRGEWKKDRGVVVTPESKPDRFGMNTPYGSYRSLGWPPLKGVRIVNGFWGVFGLRIRGKDIPAASPTSVGPNNGGVKTAESALPMLDRQYALETPFAAASWRDITLLGPDVFIAWLSGNVVLVDFRTNRIARLARGSCPSVLVDLEAAPKRKVHWVTYQDWEEALGPGWSTGDAR